MKRTTALFAVAALLAAAQLSHAGQRYIVAQQERSGVQTPAQKPRELDCKQPQAPVSDLEDYVGAHFDALEGAPVAFPAHALNKLKAAAGPVS